MEIYQDNDNKIFVNAYSNSEFFERLQYEVSYDKPITKSDVNIEWTTLMGNPEATKEEQLNIAVVSISENGEIFNKQKINFVSTAIDIIVDTINKNKN